MRTVVLISALLIAEALSPMPFPESKQEILAGIIIAAMLMDVVDFIRGHWKSE